MPRLEQGSKTKLPIVSLGLCILRTWTLGSPEYKRKRKKKKADRDRPSTYLWLMKLDAIQENVSKLGCRSCVHESRWIRRSSADWQLTWRPQIHLSKQRPQRPIRGEKKNVIANNKDLLPEQQLCPLFLIYYISLFKQFVWTCCISSGCLFKVELRAEWS